MTQEREISIAFQTNKNPAQYAALAKLVNNYDFDAVTVYSDAPFHPGFGALLLMAPHIERARLGVAGVSPARMTPVDMAGNLALLAGVAGGGAYLGVVRGSWLGEHGVEEPGKPLTAIREAVHIVRMILGGEEGGFEGQAYQIAPHVRAPYPLPDEVPPVLIGTWGPQLCAIAGEIADEVKVGGSANPDLVPVIAERIAVGEKRAGRDPGSVGVVMGAVSVVDSDRELARALARVEVAMYLPVVASLDPTVEIDPGLLARIRATLHTGEAYKTASLISDDLLDRFALAGNPDDLIQQTLELFEAGASRVEFGTPHGIDSIAGLRLLGEQVVPAIRRMGH